jgi:hypothetical protein
MFIGIIEVRKLEGLQLRVMDTQNTTTCFYHFYNDVQILNEGYYKVYRRLCFDYCSNPMNHFWAFTAFTVSKQTLCKMFLLVLVTLEGSWSREF